MSLEEYVEHMMITEARVYHIAEALIQGGLTPQEFITCYFVMLGHNTDSIRALKGGVTRQTVLYQRQRGLEKIQVHLDQYYAQEGYRLLDWWRVA